jgi:hypothetical protein
MPEDVFRWIVTVAVVLACIAFIWQAFVIAAIYRAGRQAQKAGKEAQNKFSPILERFEAILTTTSKILDENRPKIAEITAETLVVARNARQQAERIAEVVNEANQRARIRIEQIDHTVDQTVQQVEQAGDAVKTAVLRPVREVNGVVNGFKAAVSAYAQGARRHSIEHATQDEEMFI